MPDPFRHHPELRDTILPADQSAMRNLDLREIDKWAASIGRKPGWRLDDQDREGLRLDFLSNRPAGDLWVFGYGSLMWDPGILFAEVRQAEVFGYARSFCFWDDGARGSAAHPGLMLMLDQGRDCTGLAFRIDEAVIEQETFVLFRREMIIGAYEPFWVTMEIQDEQVTGFAFRANHAHPWVRPGFSIAQKARMIATASGLLGDNFSYLSETRAKLLELGMADPYVDSVYEAVVTTRNEMGRQ